MNMLNKRTTDLIDKRLHDAGAFSPAIQRLLVDIIEEVSAEKGQFQFRPPLKSDGLIEDEMLLNTGEFFVHMERMDTNHIWMAITDNNSGKGYSFNFFAAQNKKAETELFVRAEEY